MCSIKNSQHECCLKLKELRQEIVEEIEDVFNFYLNHLYNSQNYAKSSTFYFNRKAIEKLERIKENIKRRTLALYETEQGAGGGG